MAPLAGVRRHVPVAVLAAHNPFQTFTLTLAHKGQPMTSSPVSVLYESPFGTLRLDSSGSAVTHVWLPCQQDSSVPVRGEAPDDILQQAVRELDAWFAGELREFTVPCDPARGTVFQREIWQELRRIPFGKTISYTELARQIGRPTAVRAVGSANARNPLPIIVPCHRVIAADGSLTGYAGGKTLKQQLLDHEQQQTRSDRPAALSEAC